MHLPRLPPACLAGDSGPLRGCGERYASSLIRRVAGGRWLVGGAKPPPPLIKSPLHMLIVGMHGCMHQHAADTVPMLLVGPL